MLMMRLPRSGAMIAGKFMVAFHTPRLSPASFSDGKTSTDKAQSTLV
jgi:hypothetical protein